MEGEEEEERPGSSHRPLTEEQIVGLQERQYDSIAEKQKAVDRKTQRELALQEEKLRLEEEALYAAQREAARAARQRKLLEVRGQPQRTPGFLLSLSPLTAPLGTSSYSQCSLFSRGCTYAYILWNPKGRLTFLSLREPVLDALCVSLASG